MLTAEQCWHSQNIKQHSKNGKIECWYRLQFMLIRLLGTWTHVKYIHNSQSTCMQNMFFSRNENLNCWLSKNEMGKKNSIKLCWLSLLSALHFLSPISEEIYGCKIQLYFFSVFFCDKTDLIHVYFSFKMSFDFASGEYSSVAVDPFVYLLPWTIQKTKKKKKKTNKTNQKKNTK